MYTHMQGEQTNIIRIRTPLFTRVCMAVHLSDEMTAGDIISKLRKRSRINREAVMKQFSDSNLLSCSSLGVGHEDSSSDSIDAGEQFLFEVGGNIGKQRGQRSRLVVNW